MTPESKTLRSICRYLDGLKGKVWYAKIRGGPYSVRGLPDIIGCVKTGDMRGQFFAMEVKAPGKHPTALQQHTLDRINAVNGEAYPVWTVADVKAVLGFYMSAKP